ncbi:copper resistance CopC/CopD family protein [Streptomyces sp. NPDC004031]
MPLRPGPRAGGRVCVRTLRRFVAGAALAVVALLALPGAAGAHADLVRSSPADGAVLTAEPRQVTLVFSERIAPRLSSVHVIGPGGQRLDEGAPVAAGPGGDRIRVGLAPERRPGTYVLTWRTTATDDGHTTTGALTFSVGAASAAPATATPTAGDRLTGAALDTAVWLGFAGLAAMTGFTAVRASCLPRPPEEEAGGGEADVPGGAPPGPGGTAVAARTRTGGVRTAPGPFVGIDVVHAPPGGSGYGYGPSWARLRWPAAVGWAAALVGTVAQLLVHGPATQGASLSRVGDRSLLSATLSTHVGHTLVARLMLLALTAVVGEQILRHRRAGAAGAVPLVLLLALTWSQTSHAPSEPLAPLGVIVTTLHVTAMAVWAGGVATLAVLLVGHRGPELAVAARRFTRLALTAVTVLIATGTYQAWRLLGSFGALTGTHYGRLLLLKIALVLAVLAAAALRHTRTPAVPTAPAASSASSRSTAPAASAVTRTVLGELAGLTAVLVVTVLLTATAPAAHGGASGPVVAPAARAAR